MSNDEVLPELETDTVLDREYPKGEAWSDYRLLNHKLTEDYLAGDLDQDSFQGKGTLLISRLAFQEVQALCRRVETNAFIRMLEFFDQTHGREMRERAGINLYPDMAALVDSYTRRIQRLIKELTPGYEYQPDVGLIEEAKTYKAAKKAAEEGNAYLIRDRSTNLVRNIGAQAPKATVVHVHADSCMCVMTPMEVEGATECDYCAGHTGGPCASRCDFARQVTEARQDSER